MNKFNTYIEIETDPLEPDLSAQLGSFQKRFKDISRALEDTIKIPSSLTTDGFSYGLSSALLTFIELARFSIGNYGPIKHYPSKYKYVMNLYYKNENKITEAIEKAGKDLRKLRSDMASALDQEKIQTLSSFGVPVDRLLRQIGNASVSLASIREMSSTNEEVDQENLPEMLHHFQGRYNKITTKLRNAIKIPATIDTAIKDILAETKEDSSQYKYTFISDINKLIWAAHRILRFHKLDKSQYKFIISFFYKNKPKVMQTFATSVKELEALKNDVQKFIYHHRFETKEVNKELVAFIDLYEAILVPTVVMQKNLLNSAAFYLVNAQDDYEAGKYFTEASEYRAIDDNMTVDEAIKYYTNAVETIITSLDHVIKIPDSIIKMFNDMTGTSTSNSKEKFNKFVRVAYVQIRYCQIKNTKQKFVIRLYYANADKLSEAADNAKDKIDKLDSDIVAYMVMDARRNRDADHRKITDARRKMREFYFSLEGAINNMKWLNTHVKIGSRV